jgi:hypothetical protein
VNGAFARAFKAEVQPVEIAAALQRELDDRAAVIDRQRTVVPNVFTIELSEHDYQRLSVFRDALTTELATLVAGYASEQRYTLLGTVSVVIDQDSELETGIFRVRSEARAEVRAVAGAGSAMATSAAAGHPHLVIAGAAYPLVLGTTVLGRGSDVDIRVEDPGVSRRHCAIVLGQPPKVRDLKSTNGTFVDGERVEEFLLTDGTSVQIGGTVIAFRGA